MKYELLSKYYYKGPELYKNEYEKRTNSISCTKLNIQIDSDNMFFLTTPQSLNLVASIYKKTSDLNKKLAALPIPATESYQRNCLIDEIILTNDIEGVHSTRREIKDVISSVPEDRRKRFGGLVLKYLLLIEYKPSIKLNTCQDIRALYNEIVLDEVLTEKNSNAPDGEIFRKEPAEVISATQQVKHTGILPESKIISSMTQTLAILHDQEINALIRTAIVHYLFGYIHPFYDGNGRTSRFISSYTLSQELNPLVAYRISYAIKEKKSDYYKAFDCCNDKKNKGDLTPFILYFLEMIDRAVENLLNSINDGYEKLTFFNKLISKAFDPQKEGTLKELVSSLIQNALFSSSDPLGRSELAQLTKVSYPTVSAGIKTLKAEGAPISEYREGHNKKVFTLDLDRVGDYLEGRNSN